MPAFAKTWSMVEWLRLASLKRFESSDQDVTSVRRNVSEGCDIAGGLRSPMSTRAPCLSNNSAVASPIPDEPPDIVLACSTHGSRWDDRLPVMMARLPLSDVKSRSLTIISVMSNG